MRTLFGVGTPRSLQGRAAALLGCLWSLIRFPETLWDVIWTMYRPSTSIGGLLAHREIRPPALLLKPFSPRAASAPTSGAVTICGARLHSIPRIPSSL